MEQRKGFTLIELMVALAVLSILIYMAFASFSIASAVSTSNQNREAVLEDMSTVLDQLTKELRQTVTVDGTSSDVGVKYPAFTTGSSNDFIRNIGTIATPTAPLAANVYYSFGANADQPILTFYTVDDSGIKHRISYSLGVPTDSSGYKGISRQYWASQSYEPCQIIYSNETETGTGWTGGVHNQPVTGQVITNFTVIRPSWSGKVVQIVLEAMVKNGSGSGSTKITRIAQITLRQ